MGVGASDHAEPLHAPTSHRPGFLAGKPSRNPAVQPSPLSALAHYKTLPTISSLPAMVLAVVARAPYELGRGVSAWAEINAPVEGRHDVYFIVRQPVGAGDVISMHAVWAVLEEEGVGIGLGERR